MTKGDGYDALKRAAEARKDGDKVNDVRNLLYSRRLKKIKGSEAVSKLKISEDEKLSEM